MFHCCQNLYIHLYCYHSSRYALLICKRLSTVKPADPAPVLHKPQRLFLRPIKVWLQVEAWGHSLNPHPVLSPHRFLPQEGCIGLCLLLRCEEVSITPLAARSVGPLQVGKASRYFLYYLERLTSRLFRKRDMYAVLWWCCNMCHKICCSSMSWQWRY